MAIALAVTGCGGDDSSTAVDTSITASSADGDTASTEATEPVGTAAADTVTDDTSTEASSSVVATVDANTATVEEIAAALTANGVSNPERWAREVEEYRPYDTDDANLGKLRDELAKYNPDAATLEASIASLTV